MLEHMPRLSLLVAVKRGMPILAMIAKFSHWHYYPPRVGSNT
jgi:hypothetical protein